MKKRRQQARAEMWRNILLALIAVAVVTVFFSLDTHTQGDSLFSRSADRKLRFTGDLRTRAYSDTERDRLITYIERHNAVIDRVTVEASYQDSYAKTPDSPIIFDIRVKTRDGATIKTSTRRATRKGLVPAILSKLDKDLRAYTKLKESGRDIKTLVNTM